MDLGVYERKVLAHEAYLVLVRVLVLQHIVWGLLWPS